MSHLVGLGLHRLPALVADAAALFEEDLLAEAGRHLLAILPRLEELPGLLAARVSVSVLCFKRLIVQFSNLGH